jgi:hypothetical protein
VTSLHLDWCDKKAAEFALRYWCPREGMPKGASNRMGIWEDGEFRGCLVFTRPPAKMAMKLCLARSEVTEIARFARWHLATPFSAVLREGIALFREHNPEVRMLVAIVEKPYRGTIFQAANWTCLGQYFPGAGERLTYAWPLDRTSHLLLEGLTVPYPERVEVGRHAV